jgi:hypothetical protein
VDTSKIQFLLTSYDLLGYAPEVNSKQPSYISWSCLVAPLPEKMKVECTAVFIGRVAAELVVFPQGRFRI